MTRLFAEAFNACDLDALARLLAEDATSEVVGSDFGVQRGPEEIRDGALAHVREDGELVARAHGDGLVLFVSAGALEMAVALTEQEGRLTALRFHTLWHDRERLEELARESGQALAEAT